MLYVIPEIGTEVVYENGLGGSYTPARVVNLQRFLYLHDQGPILVDEVTIEAGPGGPTITVPLECVELAAEYEPPFGFHQLLGDFGAS